jgi:hypothetical protein
MLGAEEVGWQIRSAFPPEPFFAPITDGCKCDECYDLATRLSHQTWDALDDETMDAHFGSLPLLSAEAFSAFLPVWLMRSLDDLEAEQQKFREWTLYAIALYDDDQDGPDELTQSINRFRWHAERLSPQQVAADRSFLRLTLDVAAITEWDRESITRALDRVWERRVEYRKPSTVPIPDWARRRSFAERVLKYSAPVISSDLPQRRNNPPEICCE